MKKPILVGVALGLITFAGSAAAQYPPPPPPPGYGGAAPAYYPPAPRPVQTFGGPGTFVLSSDFSGGINMGFNGSSQSNNGPSSWTLTLQPAADYFVIQGLSVGGIVAYAHDHTSSTDQASGVSATSDGDTFGIGARVGYNIPINDLLSFWPKVGLIFNFISGTSGGSVAAAGGNNGFSGNTFDVNLYAPLLLHLAPHFFVGLGPGIQTDLSSSYSFGGQERPDPRRRRATASTSPSAAGRSLRAERLAAVMIPPGARTRSSRRPYPFLQAPVPIPPGARTHSSTRPYPFLQAPVPIPPRARTHSSRRPYPFLQAPVPIPPGARTHSSRRPYPFLQAPVPIPPDARTHSSRRP